MSQTGFAVQLRKTARNLVEVQLGALRSPHRRAGNAFVVAAALAG